MKWYIGLFIVICLMLQDSKAEYIDLNEAKILGKPQLCKFGGKVKACALLKHKNNYYQAVVDEKGEYAIYLVDIRLDGDTAVVINPRLMWARESI